MKRIASSGGVREGTKKKRKKQQKLPAATVAASGSDDDGTATAVFVPPRCAVPELLGPHHIHRAERPVASGDSGGGGGSAREDSDEWQTCKESWAELAPLLAHFKRKRVWMPFYYDGVCATHLRDVGFKSVFHKRRDFFQLAKDSSFLAQIDVIIDNPPYTGETMKTNVLRALRATNKPFCVLLPLTVLHSKLLRDVLDTKHVQAIIPRRVMVRKSETDCTAKKKGKKNSGGGGDGGGAMGGGAVPFKYLVWLCYRMGIKGGLQFV